MDLRWSAYDLAWGELLVQRFGAASSDRRLASWDEGGIAAAVLPEGNRPVADPSRAMIAMQVLGHVLATELPAETLVMAAHLLPGREGEALFTGGRLKPERPTAVAWVGRGTDYSFLMRSTASSRGWRLSGVAPIVADINHAKSVLIGGRCGGQAQLFCLPLRAEGLSRRTFRTITGGEAAEIAINDVYADKRWLVATGDPVERAMRKAIAVATTLACARACGMMRYLLEATVGYLRERKQFGRALAEFQVLQHRAVDMLIEIELAEAATLRAILSLQLTEQEQALTVAAAKVTASNSARFVGQNAIQLHGGKGMDARTPITAYFRALTSFELSFGFASQHLERLAAVEA